MILWGLIEQVSQSVQNICAMPTFLW